MDNINQKAIDILTDCIIKTAEKMSRNLQLDKTYSGICKGIAQVAITDSTGVQISNQKIRTTYVYKVQINGVEYRATSDISGIKAGESIWVLAPSGDMHSLIIIARRVKV